MEKTLGWLAREAVVVFFVISGFAIFTSIRSIVSGERPFLTEYAIRRVCRIFPPLIFAIVVSCASAAVISSTESLNWVVDVEQFIRGITLTYKTGEIINLVDGPLWSLRLEICLYVISGALVLTLRNSGGLGRLAACTAAALVSLAMVGKLWFAVPALALFGFGAAAAWLDRFVAPKPFAAAAAVALLSLLSFGCFLDATASFDGLETVQGHVLQLSSGLCVAVLLSEMRTQGRCVLDGFSRLSSTGSFSYTLYIVHMPILLLLHSVAMKSLASSGVIGQAFAALASLILAFSFAFVSAKVFERPEWYRRKVRLFLAKVPLSARASSPSLRNAAELTPTGND